MEHRRTGADPEHDGRDDDTSEGGKAAAAPDGDAAPPAREPADATAAEADGADAGTTDTADADATADRTAVTAAAGSGTPRAARPGRATRWLLAGVSLLGELLITAGIVLGLFVAYSLWWTNVVANQEARRDGDAVREQWQQQEAAEPGLPPVYDAQDGIGFLHVPAMNEGEILVKEGIDLDILNGGVAGYYDEPVESAMPWDDEGNFSLAAHRDGHGAKFHDIHKLDEGDAIVFETQDTWYVYTVYATLPSTSRYNTAVLDPVPAESGATEPGRYITLTTCTPIYTSTYRYIVWGELERTEPIDADRTPPPELAAG
ncbi:class E sortase [Streptomyces bohaiensis]|uniref:class E sortase n=1 Tax=Streptomyces bohaiensis TaxID=1431344 RepID=UPI0028A6B893|nr:class E sortase [Streptomyces bohaiensis]